MTLTSQQPPDAYNINELREMLAALVSAGHHAVALLDAPPLDFPGCDDKRGLFAWWEITELIDGEWKRTGVFHLPHGVEI